MSVFRRFPSYDQIVNGAWDSAARFPFALLSALAGVVAAIILVGPDHSTDHPALQKLLACAALGLPLFIALTTFAEKRAWSQTGRLLVQAVGLVLLVAYYFSLPADMTEPMHHLVRLALLNIGLHFLVAWLPWTGKDQLTGFWEYNKTLFLHFLVSALFSAVLYVGLALALLAADQLFGVEVKGERYFQLWILIAGLFNTWVFLAGVPKDLQALNRGGEYPNGLRVLTQFILLPLVVLYFVILIAYEAKIIITWNWPKGWVSELVLWYSIVGMFSLLLLHPLRERLKNRWIQEISKWFYRLLIPLVAMLFLAILRRISDYGVTENRYFVLAMAVGLTAVMLYMIVSKRKDVRFIPIVLCLLAFFSAYGPWSTFAVSRANQLQRLEAKMIGCGLLVDGNLTTPSGEPSVEDRQAMSSAVAYLNEHYGINAFSDWLPDSTRQKLDTLPVYDRAEEITQELGFDYLFPSGWNADGKWVHLTIGDQQAIDVSGYDLMLPFEGLGESAPGRSFPVDQDTCRLVFDTTDNKLTIQFSGPSYDSAAIGIIHLEESLLQLMKNAVSDKFTVQELSFHAVGQDTIAKVVVEVVNGRKVESGLEIYNMSGFLLLCRHQ